MLWCQAQEYREASAKREKTMIPLIRGSQVMNGLGFLSDWLEKGIGMYSLIGKKRLQEI